MTDRPPVSWQEAIMRSSDPEGLTRALVVADRERNACQGLPVPILPSQVAASAVGPVVAARLRRAHEKRKAGQSTETR
jgi:hypothetical protein